MAGAFQNPRTAALGPCPAAFHGRTLVDRDGLHAQLVSYAMSEADGMNVGFNNKQTASVGGPPAEYVWYAGALEVDAETGERVAKPIEFGAIVSLTFRPPIRREIEYDVQVRLQARRSDLDRIPHVVQIEPPPVTLVGEGREGKAVCHHEVAMREGRTHHITYECSARSQDEHKLGLGRHVHLRPRQDDLTDRLTDRRTPGLPRRYVRQPEGVEPLG